MLKKMLIRLALLINLLTCFFIVLSNSNPYYNIQKIAESLHAKFQEPVPKWVVNQIASDLEGSFAITSEGIDETFKNYKGLIIRYKVVNGNIDIQFNKGNWCNHPVSFFVTLWLKELNGYVSLPNVDFLMVLDDEVGQQCSVPVLGFCKKINDKNILLIPDYQVFHAIQPVNVLGALEFNIFQKISDAVECYPWNKKESKAIWRGTDTGGKYTINTYEQLPRVQLVNLSNKYPNILDAKFNGLHNKDSAIINKFKELNYMGSFLTIEDNLKYKYQILMDGNTASWPGAYWRFHSNCLVLKQDSENIQWYYSLLKPNEHYIPFAKNTEDLIEKIQWAMDNDEQVQQIVKNANELCAKCLTYADILYYFYIVIKVYAKLQNIKLSNNGSV